MGPEDAPEGFKGMGYLEEEVLAPVGVVYLVDENGDKVAPLVNGVAIVPGVNGGPPTAVVKAGEAVSIDITMQDTKPLIWGLYTGLPEEELEAKLAFPVETGPSNQELVRRLARRIPGMKQSIACPSCGDIVSVEQQVIHLNDVHRWTRERIADWLDTLSIDLTVQDAPTRHDRYGVIQYKTWRGMIRFILAVPDADYNLMVELDVRDLQSKEWVPDQLDIMLSRLSGLAEWQVNCSVCHATDVASPDISPFQDARVFSSSVGFEEFRFTVHKIPFTSCDRPIGTIREVLNRGGYTW